MSNIYFGFFHQDTGKRIQGCLNETTLQEILSFDGTLDSNDIMNFLHEYHLTMDPHHILFLVTQVVIKQKKLNDENDQYIISMKDGDESINWRITRGKIVEDKNPDCAFFQQCLSFIYEDSFENHYKKSEVLK